MNTIATMAGVQPMTQKVTHAATTTEPAGPLRAEHYAALRAASARRRRVDRAAGVATFNAWSAAIAAAVTATFALFSVTALVMAVGFAAVAWVEFRGRTMLRQLDERGPRLLAMNQAALFLLLLGYCAWSIYVTLGQAGVYGQMLADHPELARVLDPQQIESLVRLTAVLVYGGVVALSAAFQGGMAIYYLTRTSHLRAYREQTPTWVLDVQRAVR